LPSIGNCKSNSNTTKVILTASYCRHSYLSRGKHYIPVEDLRAISYHLVIYRNNLYLTLKPIFSCGCLQSFLHPNRCDLHSDGTQHLLMMKLQSMVDALDSNVEKSEDRESLLFSLGLVSPYLKFNRILSQNAAEFKKETLQILINPNCRQYNTYVKDIEEDTQTNTFKLSSHQQKILSQLQYNFEIIHGPPGTGSLSSLLFSFLFSFLLFFLCVM
jgi:hypothetical protein